MNKYENKPIDNTDLIAIAISYFGVALLGLLAIGVMAGWWCPPFVCIRC